MTFVSAHVAPETAVKRILLIRRQLPPEKKQEEATVCDHLAKSLLFVRTFPQVRERLFPHKKYLTNVDALEVNLIDAIQQRIQILAGLLHPMDFTAGMSKFSSK